MKIKGVSTQSIIIGSIITAVIAVSGLALMWESVHKSKVYTLAENLDEQHAFLVSDAAQNYKTLFSSQKKAFSDGDTDFLDELIIMGKISKPPLNLFKFEDKVEWEIRMINDFGKKPNFYIHLSSPSVEDQRLIDEAVKLRGYKPEIVDNFILKAQ